MSVHLFFVVGRENSGKSQYTVIGMVAIHIGKLIGIRIVDRINTEMMRKMVYIVLGIPGLLYTIQ